MIGVEGRRPWARGPAAPRLEIGAVHVWLADLDAIHVAPAALLGTLSSDERTRADRFVFDRDRRRFAYARGVLRTLVGRYLDEEPQAVEFEYGEHGKPRLRSACDRGVRFNASHSGSLAVFAFARGRELGVDIEAVRPMNDGHEIAERFFSAREVDDLRSLPPSVQHNAFFACWTRKEAYLKALGDGLARPLDTFDVTFTPAAPPRLHVAGDPCEQQRWALMPLAAPHGYAAALVAERPVETVECWTWTESTAGRHGVPVESLEAV